MKIQILRDILVADVYNPKLDETFDRQLKKWEVMTLEKIAVWEKTADMVTWDGNTMLDVPLDAFKVV